MSDADEPPTELSPVDTIRQLKRRVLRRAFFAFLAASMLTLVAAHCQPLKYTGTTKFTLRSDSASRDANSPANESLETLKLTLPHDLLDQDALERVIRDLGLDKGLPHNAQGELTPEGEKAHQALVDEIRQQAVLTWEVRSPVVDLLSLSVTSDAPNLARQIPNELVKNYIERSSAQITQRLADSNSFLVSQVNSCSARLRELKSQWIAFEIQHARMMPESPGIVQKRIDDLEAEILKLSRDKLTAQDRLREATVRVAKLSELFPRAADILPAQDANQLKALVDAYRKSRPGSGPATELAYPPASQPATPPAGGELIEIMKVPNPEQAHALTAPQADPLGIDTMYNALREWNLAARECQYIYEDLADMKARRDEMIMLISNFALIRQQWEELNNKVAECQKELTVWQNRRNDVQIALEGEVAQRRTHMETVQAAQFPFLPESPKLSRILAGILCVALLAIHWAISPLVTIGQKAIAVVWVLLASVALFLLTIHPLAVLLLTGCVVVSALLAGALDRCWTRSRGGAVLVVHVALLIIVAAAVATMSLTLRLQFPDMYTQWKADPLAFIYDNWLVKIIEAINRP